MKLLTKHTDYAVRALVALADDNEGFVSARDISRRQKIPYAFLRRLFPGLIKKGWVASREGFGGGVRLAGDPADIRVTEVIELFQGPIRFSECLFRKKICPNRAQCPLRETLIDLEKFVAAKFKNMTIGGLLKKTRLKRRKK